jgi:hypothetical protein
VVTHHNSVLEQQEIAGPSEFLNLGEWTGRCRLRAEGDEFRELKFILRNILSLAVVATFGPIRDTKMVNYLSWEALIFIEEAGKRHRQKEDQNKTNC